MLFCLVGDICILRVGMGNLEGLSASEREIFAEDGWMEMSFRQVNVKISCGLWLVTQQWVVFSLTQSKTWTDF